MKYDEKVRRAAQKPIALQLTAGERFALLEALRISFEDGSIETHVGVATCARRAEAKLLGEFA